MTDEELRVTDQYLQSYYSRSPREYELISKAIALFAEVRALRASVEAWIRTVEVKDDEIRRLQERKNERMTDEELNAIEVRRDDLHRARPALNPEQLAKDADPWDWFIERDVPALLAEVRLLKAERAIVYCAFCGHEYKLGKVRGEEARIEAMMTMAEHLVGCEKHPMRQAVIENQRLVKENAELKSRLADLTKPIHDPRCTRHRNRPLLEPGVKE